MIRYTVLWAKKAESELATLWLAYPDRQAISDATDRIDATLREDAHTKGWPLPQAIRSVSSGPLTAYFRVDEHDRKAFVDFIKLTDSN